MFCFFWCLPEGGRGKTLDPAHLVNATAASFFSALLGVSMVVTDGVATVCAVSGGFGVNGAAKTSSDTAAVVGGSVAACAAGIGASVAGTVGTFDAATPVGLGAAAAAAAVARLSMVS